MGSCPGPPQTVGSLGQGVAGRAPLPPSTLPMWDSCPTVLKVTG